MKPPAASDPEPSSSASQPPPGNTQAVTLAQLLGWVEQACRGDKPLSQRLFAVFMQMRLHPKTPANEKALAEVLIRILIGERAPALDQLDAEDVQPVRDLLQRLSATPNP